MNRKESKALDDWIQDPCGYPNNPQREVEEEETTFKCPWTKRKCTNRRFDGRTELSDCGSCDTFKNRKEIKEEVCK